MYRAVTALVLVLTLLACPLVCRGVAAASCRDTCCDADEPQPSQHSPADPCGSDPCQGSGASCICTGVTTGEPVRPADQMTNALASPALARPVTLAHSARAVLTRDVDRANPLAALSGVTLRALLQSFLL